MSTNGRICAAPLPVRDRLYVAGSDGLLLEVDSLGQVRATADLGAAVHTRLAHDGYRLYAGASDGTVRAFSLDRQRGFELIPVWQTPLGGEITGLATIGGQVYAAAGDSVLKLDPESGARALVVRMECPVAAAPVASAGRLLGTWPAWRHGLLRVSGLTRVVSRRPDLAFRNVLLIGWYLRGKPDNCGYTKGSSTVRG